MSDFCDLCREMGVRVIECRAGYRVQCRHLGIWWTHATRDHADLAIEYAKRLALQIERATRSAVIWP